LKFWLGVVVITDIGLVGWLIAAVDTADALRLLLGIFGVIVLSFSAWVLHQDIDRHMKQIGKL
jgi:hypothetical protein